MGGAAVTDCRTSLQVETRNAIEADARDNFTMVTAMVRKAMADRYGGRLPPGFEADHWVLEAYRKALTQLDVLPEGPAAHAEFRERWTRHNYLATVAINAATDAAEKAGERLATQEEQERQERKGNQGERGKASKRHREAPPSLEDEVIARWEGAQRRTALAVILRALVWRSGTAGPTGITAQQWETVHAFTTIQKASVPDGGADNATLHSETVTYLQRAREEWAKESKRRRAGQPIVHRDGLRTATARLLGISPATVTSHLRATARAVKFTRYVAGVLAHDESLQHPACVKHHLNVADALPAAGYATEHKLLSTGADHVHTTEQNGTRVDPASYLSAGASTVDELHDAETLYADRAHSTWPNCVAICTPHTLNGWTSRATEF